MILDQYLKESLHGERRRLASALGVSESTVHRWRRGTAFPNRRMIKNIEFQTSGAVRPVDWFESQESRSE